MEHENLFGKVVYANAGRDKGKSFIIISVIDDKYVCISDGSSRKLEKPKKKKLKHLRLTDFYFDKNNELTNHQIRKYLRLVDINKEV